MKLFRFRLEPVLRMREAARDERRLELAQTISEHQRLLAEQLLIEQKLVALRQSDRELRRASDVSLELLRQFESRRKELAGEQAELSEATLRLSSQIEACQRRLSDAECEYQAVARLRARRLAEYQREVLREESKLADEAAVRSFRRAS